VQFCSRAEFRKAEQSGSAFQRKKADNHPTAHGISRQRQAWLYLRYVYMENQNPPAQSGDEKKPLISRVALVVCSILSVLVATNNAASSGTPGQRESITYAFGEFFGAFLASFILFAGGWSIVVLVFR
jgi:hypothetical protein